MHPAFRPLFGATRYLGDETAIERTKAHAKQTVRGLFEFVNTQLSGRDWIAGARSTAEGPRARDFHARDLCRAFVFYNRV